MRSTGGLCSIDRDVDSHEIKEFWSQQAREHGESPAASWSDHRVIELEIAAIGARLEPGRRVLDAGCANGYSSARYAALGADVVGVDYIPEMIANAESRRQALPAEVAGKLRFRVGDVRSLEFEDASFDAVVSTRVIINLPSWDEQLSGLRECVRVLGPGGLFLLSEATRQGWQRLNVFRREWGLGDIPMPSFNLYLDQDRVVNALAGEVELRELSDFASSYYIASRLLKPLLAAGADGPIDVADPDAEFNRWAATLPPVGDYGTQKLFVFEKR
jgi:SAM-dependent methyltransferase